MSIQATQAAKRALAAAEQAAHDVAAAMARLAELEARIKAIEDRPRPGRPPNPPKDAPAA